MAVIIINMSIRSVRIYYCTCPMRNDMLGTGNTEMNRTSRLPCRNLRSGMGDSAGHDTRYRCCSRDAPEARREEGKVAESRGGRLPATGGLRRLTPSLPRAFPVRGGELRCPPLKGQP